ncbi:MAG TPA: hypothetical protein VF236_02545 [Gaiellaceae bacterium]
MDGRRNEQQRREHAEQPAEEPERVAVPGEQHGADPGPSMNARPQVKPHAPWYRPRRCVGAMSRRPTNRAARDAPSKATRPPVGDPVLMLSRSLSYLHIWRLLSSVC